MQRRTRGSASRRRRSGSVLSFLNSSQNAVRRSYCARSAINPRCRRRPARVGFATRWRASREPPRRAKRRGSTGIEPTRIKDQATQHVFEKLFSVACLFSFEAQKPPKRNFNFLPRYRDRAASMRLRSQNQADQLSERLSDGKTL